LYQPTKAQTQVRASSSDRKPRPGYSGRYFIVRKSASEYGLSSLTRGRLKDVATPSRCSVARIVAPFRFS
jgi:hypothetical protein